MRKLTCLSAIAIILLSGFKSDTFKRRESNVYAVIVGVGTYKDSNFPALLFPEKDATEFYNLLVSPYCGSVPLENVALLTGSKATRANIVKELISKFSRAGSDDIVMFYFSGHGKGGEMEGSGYLLNVDAENDNEGATALSMDEITSKFEHSKAKVKISYIDACHAGLFKSTGKGLSDDENNAIADAVKLGYSAAGDGTVSFLASTARQQSQESKKLGHGIFTYYLLKGLKGEADRFRKTADGYGNNIVTSGELASYLISKVEAETGFKQRPNIVGDFDDNFPLSVLSPSVSMATEIAKRPPRKVKIASVATTTESKPEKPKWDLADRPFRPENNIAGGYYYIINNFKEPIMVYVIQNTCTDCNILIAPGMRGRTPKLVTGTYNAQTGTTNNTVAEYILYFMTTDKSKPARYGQMIVPVDAYIERSLVVSEDNLYLATTNRKF